jgi:peptidoglycan/xylan/chitin deacetylase (PgdA/CDA1 family)
MWVSPSLLKFQISLLQTRGYSFYTLSEAMSRRPNSGLIAAITFDDGYEDNLSLGLPVLQTLNVPATVYVVTGDVGGRRVIWGESGDKVPSDLMSWDQLKHLQNAGWEIGSHAHDHVHLGRRPAVEQQQLISQSYDVLSKNLGIAPQSFAYPYGSFDANTPELIRLAGFSNAVTTDSGKNDEHSDPFLLKRFPARGYKPHHYLKSLQMLGW